ncbi:MAG TPA: SDR family oxidoreductase [Acidimicrobiales bacterium]
MSAELEPAAIGGPQLEGRTAIVTGGHTGIGLAVTRLFARHGANIAVFGRDQTAGAAAVDEAAALGAEATFVPIDLGVAAAIAPAVESVIDTYGGVDILVNNAGTRGFRNRKGIAGLFDIDADNWDFVQAINTRAPFLLIQAVGRHLIDRGKGGNIVNVTSSSAFMAAPASLHYAASKAALTSLTRTCAAELGLHGVNVNAVAPAITRTEYRLARGTDEGFKRSVSEGRMQNLMHSVAEPEDVAEAVLFLCLPSSRQITGQTIHTSAGLLV